MLLLLFCLNAAAASVVSLDGPGVREVMDDVRQRWRWYPRVLRHSVTLSHLGEALWRDCYPAACAIDKKRARY